MTLHTLNGNMLNASLPAGVGVDVPSYVTLEIAGKVRVFQKIWQYGPQTDDYHEVPCQPAIISQREEISPQHRQRNILA